MAQAIQPNMNQLEKYRDSTLGKTLFETLQELVQVYMLPKYDILYLYYTFNVTESYGNYCVI